MLSLALGLQLVIGALITSVSAITTGEQTSIAISVLGGMSTLAASYLAKARGSNEPEHSIIKCRDLENLVRELEATILDQGEPLAKLCGCAPPARPPCRTYTTNMHTAHRAAAPDKTITLRAICRWSSRILTRPYRRSS